MYGRSADQWWQRSSAELARFENLTVINWNKVATDALAKTADRNMQLQCTIQDGQILVSAADESLQISNDTWK